MNKNKIILVKPCGKYFKSLIKIRNSKDIQELVMSNTKNNNLKSVILWLKNYERSKTDHLYLITIENKDNCIGYIQLNNISINPSCAKMGIVISKEYQNLGYGNQAIKNLIKIARNSLKLKKIILEVLSLNERAIKLYLSLGFLNVGCMLKHYKYKGKLINVNIMEKNLR